MDDMYFSNKVVEVDTGTDNSISDYASVGLTNMIQFPSGIWTGLRLGPR